VEAHPGAVEVQPKEVTARPRAVEQFTYHGHGMQRPIVGRKLHSSLFNKGGTVVSY
jgi:hypothetical protein